MTPSVMCIRCGGPVGPGVGERCPRCAPSMLLAVAALARATSPGRVTPRALDRAARAVRAS